MPALNAAPGDQSQAGAGPICHPFFLCTQICRPMACIPTCTSASNPPKYEPITCMDYALWFTCKIYDHVSYMDGTDAVGPCSLVPAQRYSARRSSPPDPFCRGRPSRRRSSPSFRTPPARRFAWPGRKEVDAVAQEPVVVSIYAAVQIEPVSFVGCPIPSPLRHWSGLKRRPDR